MRTIVARFPVLVFVLLTLAYQFLVVGMVWALLGEGERVSDDAVAHMVFRLRLVGPLLFAVGITAYLDGLPGLRNLFGSYLRWKVPAKWYLLGLTWKFLFVYVGMAGVALLGIAAWPGFVVPDFFGGTWGNMVNLAKALPFIVGIAFVEETAWMKFSVTRMQGRYSALVSCVIVGVSWSLWYLPMLLAGEGTPDGIPVPMFLLSMVSLTILLAWVYNMTRSGAILLVMQIVSNCAFFMVPVLPGFWEMDATYVNSFVVVNACVASTLVVVYGWRELGVRKRATWDAGHEPAVEPVGGMTTQRTA